MRIVLALLLAIVSAAAWPAAAQPWAPLDFVNAGTPDHAIAYLDVGSAKSLVAGERKMNIAYVYERLQHSAANGKEYRWIEIAYALDCAAQTMRSTRSASMTIAGPVSTSAGTGNTIPFKTSLALYRAATAVCASKFADFEVSTYYLGENAPSYFAAAEALAASQKSRSWARVTMIGMGSAKLAVFVDRGGMQAGYGTLRYGTMATVSDVPGGPPYALTRVEIDCARGSLSRRLSETPSPDRDRQLIFVDISRLQLTPDLPFNAVRAPICNGTFGSAKTYAMLPGQLRATAFQQ